MKIDDFSSFESFEPLINETIALYESYEQQIDQELLRVDSHHEKNTTDNVESSIANLYERTSDKFDFLLKKINKHKLFVINTHTNKKECKIDDLHSLRLV